MKHFWSRHKTLLGVVVIALGIVILSVDGVRSFDQKAHHVTPTPILGALSLGLGFRLMIADERHRHGRRGEQPQRIAP